MFPIRDHNPSNRTPIVTWALIAANIVIFLTYFPESGGNESLLLGFYDEWALTPGDVFAGEKGHTILTYMFLHGGWMHLIGNMLFLYIFGDNLEDLLGHLGFLLFYLACGVAAAAGQMVSDLASKVPMVGASGAIAGVMGGYLLFFPKARIDMLVIIIFLIRIFTIPAWLMLGLWFGLQLANGLAMDVAAGGGVAYWAHAGGFVAGVLLMLPVWLRRGGTTYWAQWHGKPPHDEVEYVMERGASGALPKFRQVRSQRDATRPLADLSRIPRSGRSRSSSRGPWSGGRQDR